MRAPARLFIVGLLLVVLLPGVLLSAAPVRVAPGPHTVLEWNRILRDVAALEPPGARIAHLSAEFLVVPYRAHSLVGGPAEEEVLVFDLAGVDCFTLLDYVEALRLSPSFSAATVRLPQVRYLDGRVAYRSRNHFLSDWPQRNAATILDVTAEVGQGRAQTVAKELNRKADGSLWLEGIPVVSRPISYLPTADLDDTVLAALKAGDYLGIYTPLEGLDVSHVGIVVRQDGQLLLRHASSLSGVEQVVDVDLIEYLSDKPGIVVYRAR
ncbi:MAG: DUF1460 domain-containing protein [Desulfuromonas sp.]|nr:MAG: DUF1460 domain-containing protein [Desulfuromonas sp.]